jgi:hypothetical protein
MIELLLASIVALSAIYAAYRMVTNGQAYTHQAWLHAVHVQDDLWKRANDQAMTYTKEIHRLTSVNAHLTKRVDELCGLRLNFAVMQDHLMENVRRSINDAMKTGGNGKPADLLGKEDPRPEDSRTSEEMQKIEEMGKHETARISKEQLVLAGVAQGGGVSK